MVSVKLSPALVENTSATRPSVNSAHSAARAEASGEASEAQPAGALPMRIAACAVAANSNEHRTIVHRIQDVRPGDMTHDDRISGGGEPPETSEKRP